MTTTPTPNALDAVAGLDPARVVLLLDIDGTLAPIVPDPADAAVPEATLKAVRSAVESCAAVGLVTGRSLERARELAPVEGAWVAAVHGMHVVAPDGSEDVCGAVDSARDQLAAAAVLAQTVGWHYEEKGHSVTVHLRQRGALAQSLDPAHVRAQLGMVLNPLAVELHDAKQAIEVRPVGARTKAHAVRSIWTAVAAGGATAIVYAGDDRTDLDAFAELARLRSEGVTTVAIAVGGEDAVADLVAAADVVVDGPADVVDVIAALVGCERRRSL